MKKRFAAIFLTVLLLVVTALPVMAAPKRAPRHAAARVVERLAIESVKYSRKSEKLEVEFNSKVQYSKHLRVVVKDSRGNVLKTGKIDRDSDDIEFRISGLKRGRTYTVVVYGVRVRGSDGDFVSVSKKFDI